MTYQVEIEGKKYPGETVTAYVSASSVQHAAAKARRLVTEKVSAFKNRKDLPVVTSVARIKGVV